MKPWKCLSYWEKIKCLQRMILIMVMNLWPSNHGFFIFLKKFILYFILINKKRLGAIKEPTNYKKLTN